MDLVAPLLVGIVLAQATPGPNMMAVTSLSLGSGRAAGLLAVAGIATGVLVWALLFAFGTAAILEAFPQLVTAMKLIGGGYLVYLALRSMRAMLAAKSGAAVQVVHRSGFAAYATGLAVVLTNPKAALMWVAIALFLASSGISSDGFLVTGLFAAMSAGVVYGGYALLFSTDVARRFYRRLARWLEGAFGLVFGALGGKLVADGIADLRG